MSNIKKLMMSAAGGEALNVEDVFSTYLKSPTDRTAYTVTNNIDLAGEGGLIWSKARTGNNRHILVDTVSGLNKNLSSNVPNAQFTATNTVTSVSSTGFTYGTDSNVNTSGGKAVHWTFRKAPKFFDVVTYTGDGVAGLTVNHSLGGVVGSMFVKCTSHADDWYVYHKETGATHSSFLNTTAAAAANGAYWNNTAPTTTQFTVGDNAGVNANGRTYVAYLFAHNDGDGEFGPDGDADIIKCGSYTTDGSEEATINLGFEPQWLLVKRTDATGGSDWRVIDSMRGWEADGDAAYVEPNTSDAEAQTGDGRYYLTSTGFKQDNFGANRDYIYIAIRRGPMAVPESAEDVFDTKVVTAGSTTEIPSDNLVDMSLTMYRSNNNRSYINNRVINAGRWLQAEDTDSEQTGYTPGLDRMTGFNTNLFSAGVSVVSHTWTRAPGYFDVIAWNVDGTGNQTINHNLGVIPEMVWHKNRSSSSNGEGDWFVAHKDLPGWDSANENDRHILELDKTLASAQQGYHRDFTDTSIRLISNGAGGFVTSHSCVGFLFATLPGISKVGSYTGSSSSVDVDCGFTSGARFVLVKRTDSTGSWYVWNSERGIVAGNDPYLILNSTTSEITGNDFIDPLSSGFTVNTGSAAINTSGGSYIFYAIA